MPRGTSCAGHSVEATLGYLRTIEFGGSGRKAQVDVWNIKGSSKGRTLHCVRNCLRNPSLHAVLFLAGRLSTDVGVDPAVDQPGAVSGMTQCRRNCLAIIRSSHPFAITPAMAAKNPNAITRRFIANRVGLPRSPTFDRERHVHAIRHGSCRDTRPSRMHSS